MTLRPRLQQKEGFWTAAKCKIVQVSRDYDPFFGQGGEQQDAIDFCNGTDDDAVCPVRHECLLAALANNEKDGVFGGTSEDDRRALRKRWPLEKGHRDPGGSIRWLPRPEWRWYPQGEPASWFPPELIADDPREAEREDS